MTVFRLAAAVLMLALSTLPARAVGVDLAARNLEIGATPLFDVPGFFIVPLGPVGLSGTGMSTGGTAPIGTLVTGVATAPFGGTAFTLAVGASPVNAIDGVSVERALDGDVVEVLFEVTNKTGAFAGVSNWILGRGALPMGFDPAAITGPFTVDAQLFEATIIPLPAALPLLAGGLGVLAMVGRRRSRA